MFFRRHVYRPEDVYLLAGDEIVATKAGKHTHELNRFFASLYGKPVPGLAFFTLSLVSTQQQRAFPLRVEQVVRSDVEKAATRGKADAQKQKAATVKCRPGRPKGSKNTPKADGIRPPELVRITRMLEALLQLSAGVVSLTSLVLDGHFGHHNTLQNCGAMPHCTSPPPAPMPDGGLVATTVAGWIMPTCQRSTSRRQP